MVHGCTISSFFCIQKPDLDFIIKENNVCVGDTHVKQQICEVWCSFKSCLSKKKKKGQNNENTCKTDWGDQFYVQNKNRELDQRKRMRWEGLQGKGNGEDINTGVRDMQPVWNSRPVWNLEAKENGY